jgi:hypothetical protein
LRRITLLFAVLVLSTGAFAAGSPFSGTWKLNIAKSKLPPPAPQSDVATIDADDNGMKFSEDVVDEKGQSTKSSLEAKFDGKDYPLTGDPNADSVSYHRPNANTLEGTAKKSGKITQKFTVKVSKDGKVTTVHFTVYPETGKPAKGVAVYDKQ